MNYYAHPDTDTTCCVCIRVGQEKKKGLKNLSGILSAYP